MNMNKATSYYDAVRYSQPGGFFRPFWHEAAKHLYRLLFDTKYRRYFWLVAKYGATPRYHQREISVHGWKLLIPDIASFFTAYREIFVEEIYAFPSQRPDPHILDCGANIGISVLYFKQKYPQARIIAYEADPGIFAVLQQNIKGNGITDVELHNKAVWSSETNVQFNVEGADGGRIGRESGGNSVFVPTVGLASLVRDRSFDFVKIDIEGAEVEVLRDGDAYLDRLQYVFVEFHSFIDRQQELGSLINGFERHGFRVHVHPPFIAKSPFLGIAGHDGMDMQLNLFFWKDEHGAS